MPEETARPIVPTALPATKRSTPSRRPRHVPKPKPKATKGKMMSILTRPRTKNFQAWVALTPDHLGMLYVTGLVETRSVFAQPVLWLDDYQFPMSRSLSLNLAIRKFGDIGTRGDDYREVSFAFPATAGEFNDIRIHWGGGEIEQIKVDDKRHLPAAGT